MTTQDPERELTETGSYVQAGHPTPPRTRPPRALLFILVVIALLLIWAFLFR